MEDGTKIKESTSTNDSSLDEEELVEVEDLESLLTQNEDDEIGSSSEEKKGPLQLPPILLHREKRHRPMYFL
jgi:hypothetical protein